ncbi:MAG: type I restriction-modification enzyme R subunit C-terminal domain-containing protein [Candidatus Cloacimonetes bacterium]|nr:type I restriction-modification enzyme R subunit C-terminal domain-containing protein [Candidatus Cloacimonadota bacterium]
MRPEGKARLEIDKQLIECGYIIQDMSDLNISAAKGVIVREYLTDTGPVDYLIFINKKPVGVIEAKEINKGEKLVVEAEKQTNRYKNSRLRFFEKVDIRFVYESTGEITRFTDYHDEDYRSRETFTFHTPDELYDLLIASNTLRNNLKHFPYFNTKGFRDCQIIAIENLEKSFALNKPKSLIQMATGAGKTYTAITSIYRLLKFCGAKRILFLVDTKNLGKQAMDEFTAYKPSDSIKTFTELYNVTLLKSSYVPESSNVVICTIQRLYSMLRNEELDDGFEEDVITNFNPKDVTYNVKYPISFFDFVFIDECHRSIYNLWKQVLDYFDFFQVGLTATPDKRTFAYFNENVVSEYSREQAVIDGVNVGEDEYIIETQVSKSGSYISKAKRVIQKRERLTRKQRWEQLDEDFVYDSTMLDKDVVNPSQIRNIIRAFKDAVETVVYPERVELPKTLIFAKSDSHADDIIQIAREEFGKGNEFCRKITYRAEGNPNDEIKSFRNDYKFRIAVTVDMIATGTDIKPLECLLFMRDVRSKNYYEQMKGRGTRVVDLEELKKVSPSALTNKDRFVIFDAVGVTTSIKTEGRTLERKPTVSMKDLLVKIALGSKDEDTLTTVAGRLTRLNRIMTKDEREEFKTISGGLAANLIVENILNAFDDDYISQKSIEKYGTTDFSIEQYNEIKDNLIEDSTEPFSNPKLRDYIIKVKQVHEQVIDDVNLDIITFSGWSENYSQEAIDIIKSFGDFIDSNKNEIEALSIIYNQKYKNKKLTSKMIKELYDIISKPPHNFTISKLWNCYYIRDNEKINKPMEYQLMDIISVIKYELGQSDILNPFSNDVKLRFKDWIFKRNSTQGYRFTEEQVAWLQMIRDHITVSLSIEEDDLDLAPFNNKGGLGKYYDLFGEQYINVMNEMNAALVA